jgi:tripartite-type tricarboxylate transporter receptor subunit TctC
MAFMRIRPLACLAALGFGLAGSAFAQGTSDSFPSRSIQLIVPYAAGGGTDLVMRAIAPGMAEALGQPIVVENKPGGGTINASRP